MTNAEARSLRIRLAEMRVDLAKLEHELATRGRSILAGFVHEFELESAVVAEAVEALESER